MKVLLSQLQQNQPELAKFKTLKFTAYNFLSCALEPELTTAVQETTPPDQAAVVEYQRTGNTDDNNPDGIQTDMSAWEQMLRNSSISIFPIKST